MPGQPAPERPAPEQAAPGQPAAGQPPPAPSSPESSLPDPSSPESSLPEPLPAKRPQVRKKRPFWRELAVLIVAALILTVLLKAFVIEVFSIPSASMENTLMIGDRVLVNRLIYHFRGVARGDIVVFNGNGSWGPDVAPPSGNVVARLYDDTLDDLGLRSDGTDYIKRVIGLPGDHVVCCNAQGRITVNGVPLNEQSYIHPGDPPSQIPFNIIVPPGRLWVMGDNRSDSADSRYHPEDPGHGTIPESAVVGRAFLILWPPSRFGDLPIPSTFAQAALHASADAVNALPVTGMAAGALFVGWRRRPRRQEPRPCRRRERRRGERARRRRARVFWRS
jgi:signal peptidase I